MKTICIIAIVVVAFYHYPGQAELSGVEEYCCKCSADGIPKLFDKMSLTLCTNDGGSPCPRLDCSCSGTVPTCQSCCECIQLDDPSATWYPQDAMYTSATCPNNNLATWCRADGCSCNGNTVQCN